MTGPEIPDILARELLTFEAAHPDPRHGHKEEAIRRDLHLTPARYWQLLLRLIDTEQALRIDPTTTHRLRRIRDDRNADRARRLGTTTH